MAYSVKPVLHNHVDKNGLQKVNIQVIHNRIKVYIPTPVKVQDKEFSDGQVIKHPLKSKYNLLIKGIIHDAEERLLKALQKGSIITRERLDAIAKGEDENSGGGIISDFIFEQVTKLKGSLSDKRLNQYRYVGEKVERYRRRAVFSQVSVAWLQGFEQYLRGTGIDGNTINNNMGILLACLHRAEEAGLIDIKQFRYYKRPAYKQKVPEYLSLEELEKLLDLLKVIEHQKMKLVGYYYALSCYTGYRLSDAKKFRREQILNGRLVLRAGKNGKVVSTPVFPRLQEIIDIIDDRPFPIDEDEARVYLKSMFKLIGIKREIKGYHSSRHTYAMQLMKLGLSRDEVAELIGDTAIVAEIYARIENKDLSDKLMKIFGDLPASKTA